MPLALRAGPLTLLLDDGGLRYVRLGECELVRRVYCAVRDADWGTVPGRIHNLQVDTCDDSFRVEFDVEHQQAEIHFAWRGAIRGEPSGQIVFEMNGIAHSAFRKNRIGFCVLHPMSLAGTPVRVRHADGSVEEMEFPPWIAPHNPFLNVVGLRHAVVPNVEVELSFIGEVFETEDQRNWLDASFKTFCTPLAQPFPAEIRAGERVFQRVTIKLHGQPERLVPAPAAAMPSEIRLELATAPAGRLPQIGFDLPADASALGDAAVQRLRVLKAAHLRCELRQSYDCAAVLSQAALAAAQLSAKLDVALFLGPAPQRELAELIELVRRFSPPIARWAVFPETGWATTRPLAELSARALRAYDPQIPVGGGTPANFLELNRVRPPVEWFEFVTWSQNPQVHATDDASIVETLAAHAALVESARQFAAGLPLIVGPITLRPRVNPYATGPRQPTPPPGELPPQVDLRQRSLLAAGWTLGSVKYLAESGVSAATYYEPVGGKGTVERDGGVLPLYHVFADIAELPQAEVVPTKSPAPLQVEALVLRSGDTTRVLVANLSSQPQRVALPTPAKSARIRWLDKLNVQEAMTSPAAYRMREDARPIENGCLTLALSPHAVARADLISSTHV